MPIILTYVLMEPKDIMLIIILVELAFISIFIDVFIITTLISTLQFILPFHRLEVLDFWNLGNRNVYFEL